RPIRPESHAVPPQNSGRRFVPDRISQPSRPGTESSRNPARPEGTQPVRPLATPERSQPRRGVLDSRPATNGLNPTRHSGQPAPIDQPRKQTPPLAPARPPQAGHSNSASPPRLPREGSALARPPSPRPSAAQPVQPQRPRVDRPSQPPPRTPASRAPA